MKDKIKWLESLRGISCLIVLFAHILSTHPLYGIYASGCGKIGVWIFMILSGFFLLFSYATSDNFFTLKDIIPFYLKKIIKLYPIFMITVFMAYRFGFISHAQGILDHLTFRAAWGHFWYMPVIFKFYLVAPLFLILFSFCKKYFEITGKFIYIALLLIICIYYSIKHPYSTYIENSYDLKWYLPVFIFGMIIVLLYSTLKNKLNTSFIYDVFALISIIMIIIQTPLFRQLLWNIAPSGFLQNQYLYLGLLSSIFLFATSFGKIFIKLLEKSNILQKCGEYSFYIYLVHFIILIKLRAMYPDFSQRAILTITSSIGFAVIFKYLQNIIDYFTKKLKIIVGFCLYLLLALFFTFNLDSSNCTNSQVADDSIFANTQESNLSQLYVPTMISKINNDYFIVDCWNHRIIYSNTLDRDITDWTILTDDNYIAGHTVCTDGELIVLDNTDNSSILVYKESSDITTKKYELTQTINNIDGRPHYVIYDSNHKYFYVISSTKGVIHVFENNNGYLKLIRSDTLTEIANSYVRSISIIDGYLYTVSGPNSICKYSISAQQFTYVEKYSVPPELSGMNQITRIDNYYYLTINTGKTGSVEETTIVRTKDLSLLKNYEYEDLYDQFGFVGQPYFITSFDNNYYITEISENKGNGIKKFNVSNDTIDSISAIYYWDAVPDYIKQRYKNIKATANTKTVVDLFLFSGQSNMSGKGSATDAPMVTNGFEFKSISDPSTLYPIVEPFGVLENNPNGINDTWENMTVLRKSGSLVSAFANSYYSYTGIPIVGVSCSEGATTISQWLPETSRYNDLINRAQTAKNYLSHSETYTLRNTYLVWCQGESDGDSQTSYTDYYSSLELLTTTLIDDNIVDHCYIIAIGKNAANETLYNSIHAAQIELCNNSPSCTLVSDSFVTMKDAGLMIDNYHYSQAAYNIVGEEAGINAAINSFKK